MNISPCSTLRKHVECWFHSIVSETNVGYSILFSIKQESVRRHPSTNRRIKHGRIRMYWIKSNVKQTCVSLILSRHWIWNSHKDGDKDCKAGNHTLLFFIWLKYHVYIIIKFVVRILIHYHWVEARKIWFPKVLSVILMRKGMSNIWMLHTIRFLRADVNRDACY